MIDIRKLVNATSVRGEAGVFHPAIQQGPLGDVNYFKDFAYETEKEAKTHAEDIVNYWQFSFSNMVRTGHRMTKL